jgi:signal transduction histidine kinase
VAGICQIHYRASGSLACSQRPDSFEIALRSSDDVLVLAAPSWWTKDRLWNALSWALAILAAALACIEYLRRRIMQREKTYQATFAARHELELTKSAIAAERQRLALDLHDTLEQTLSAAMLHLHAVKTAEAPTLSQKNLALFEKALRHSREELRHSIEDLHARVLRHKTLHEAIEESCSVLALGYKVDLQVLSLSEVTVLDTAIAQNLLFLVRESVANALKHARASLVVVTIEQRDAYIEITVEDDGIGFDINRIYEADRQRYGMAGMRQRAKRVEGSVSFSHREPSGTRVLISAPLQLQPLAPV